MTDYRVRAAKQSIDLPETIIVRELQMHRSCVLDNITVVLQSCRRFHRGVVPCLGHEGGDDPAKILGGPMVHET